MSIRKPVNGIALTEAHACTIAVVKVDTETGEVVVLSLKSAYEIGRQVNPALVEGQIRGGSVMGMAHALYETTHPYYPEVDHIPAGFNEYVLPGLGEFRRLRVLSSSILPLMGHMG